MTSSQPQQPVRGRLADRLSAASGQEGDGPAGRVSMLRLLDRYDRALYRSVARMRLPLVGAAVGTVIGRATSAMARRGWPGWVPKTA